MADREGVHVFKKQLILSKLYGDKILGELLLFQTVALNGGWSCAFAGAT